MAAELARRAGNWFPEATSLPPHIWRKRHRGVIALLLAHSVGLVALGLYRGVPVLHVLLEGAGIAAIAGIAAWPRLSTRAQSVLAGFGLMSCSGVLVHLSGGYIEAHFHFFVMLGVIFLYEDWVPYVLAVAYVAVHHGIAGTIDPLSVYNHPSAIEHPWAWAGVHAFFILGLSVTLLVAWNVIDRARRAETKALDEAHELRRQLGSQEKMAALGSLVSGLAHEVRTPLTVVAASAALLESTAKRDPDNTLAPRVLAATNEIQSGVERINSLVLQLRRFHALAPDEMRVVSLDAVVREALRLFAAANKSARAVQTDLTPTLPAQLHLLGVQQVVLNLVGNAVDATDPANAVVHVRTFTEGQHAVLVVEDNGAGMSDEVQRRAFDPLFTTKKEGMGLGLHIVRRIVEAHGGSIRIDSAPGKGTRITVRFRAQPPEDRPAQAAETKAPAASTTAPA